MMWWELRCYVNVIVDFFMSLIKYKIKINIYKYYNYNRRKEE